jgi:hypothetical protein
VADVLAVLLALALADQVVEGGLEPVDVAVGDCVVMEVELELAVAVAVGDALADATIRQRSTKAAPSGVVGAR